MTYSFHYWKPVPPTPLHPFHPSPTHLLLVTISSFCVDRSVSAWWEGKLVQPAWETVCSFLKKLKLELPCDPIIPPLDIYPKKIKSII